MIMIQAYTSIPVVPPMGGSIPYYCSQYKSTSIATSWNGNQQQRRFMNTINNKNQNNDDTHASTRLSYSMGHLSFPERSESKRTSYSSLSSSSLLSTRRTVIQYQQPSLLVGKKRTVATRTALQFALLNWDDVLYQTESIGNTLASWSFQQSSNSPDHNNMIITAFPIMYGAGLFTSFSPCVWGLLPLTISYISTAANERRDQQTLLPTIAFAAGLATVFCTMGMLAVTIGTVFGSTTSMSSSSSSAAANIVATWTTLLLPILSNTVCLIMGLKLLDLVDIPLPSFSFASKWFAGSSTSANNSNPNSKSNSSVGPILLDATGREVAVVATTTTTTTTALLTTSRKMDDRIEQDEGNALLRTFLLGGSSALVASPCATPVLTSILAYVANSMSSSSGESAFVTTITGAILLFGYTLGYSTPLLVVAATSGQALVRIKQQQQQQQLGTNAVTKMNNHENTGRESPISFLKLQSLLYNIPNLIAPWVTPITGGILLYLGTSGLLVHLIGEPSLIGLTIIE